MSEDDLDRAIAEQNMMADKRDEMDRLHARISELEAELARLKSPEVLAVVEAAQGMRECTCAIKRQGGWTCRHYLALRVAVDALRAAEKKAQEPAPGPGVIEVAKLSAQIAAGPSHTPERCPVCYWEVCLVHAEGRRDCPKCHGHSWTPGTGGKP